MLVYTMIPSHDFEMLQIYVWRMAFGGGVHFFFLTASESQPAAN